MLGMCRLIVAAYVLLQCIYIISGNEAHTRLLDDPLVGYDKRVKPVPADAGSILEAVCSFALIQIIDVDERKQILDTIFWNDAVWVDKRLMWDPSNYDGMTSINMNSDDIWLPTLSLYNTVDLDLSVKGAYTTSVKLNFTGDIIWEYMANYRSSCLMNLRHFPFDIQRCRLQLLSLQYSATELNFTLKPAATSNYSSFYIKNSEFELLDVSTSRLLIENPYGQNNTVAFINIHFDIEFKRRLTSYVMNMILPCCFISIIALLGFYTPADSGEKLGIGITVLLSMSVFFLILSDKMPPTSNFPLIGYYYFGVMLLVTLSTILAAWVLDIHHRCAVQSQAVPSWIETLCFKILAKWLCLKLAESDSSLQDSDLYQTVYKQSDASRLTNKLSKVQPISINDDDMIGDQVSAVLDKIQTECEEKQHIIAILCDMLRDLRSLKARIQRDEGSADSITQWKQVAFVVDRLLLVIFLFITSVFSAVILLVAASGDHVSKETQSLV